MGRTALHQCVLFSASQVLIFIHRTPAYLKHSACCHQHVIMFVCNVISLTPSVNSLGYLPDDEHKEEVQRPAQAKEQNRTDSHCCC